LGLRVFEELRLILGSVELDSQAGGFEYVEKMRVIAR
jgi:hypothetical protein